MKELSPPLTGGYPVIALITYAGEHDTCGFVILASDSTGAETIETGVGTTGKNLNATLATKALIHAEQRESLIRTWRPQLNAAVIDAGGEAYLDVPANIRIDDPAYIDAIALATDLASERALRREAGGYAKTDHGPLVIATDGSRSRAGRGAWAWISEDGRWGSGDGEFTSPLHAEVAAISAALRGNVTDRPLLIQCDSRDAITQVTRALAGEPVSDTTNNSVARVLGTITRNHGGRDVTIEWVKGHSAEFNGNLNDRADRLARLTRRSGGLDAPEVRELARGIADLTPMAA